jgi:hypothetical protein
LILLIFAVSWHNFFAVSNLKAVILAVSRIKEQRQKTHLFYSALPEIPSRNEIWVINRLSTTLKSSQQHITEYFRSNIVRKKDFRVV